MIIITRDFLPGRILPLSTQNLSVATISPRLDQEPKCPAGDLSIYLSERVINTQKSNFPAGDGDDSDGDGGGGDGGDGGDGSDGGDGGDGEDDADANISPLERSHEDLNKKQSVTF